MAIERTVAESVPRSTPLCAERGTPLKQTERDAERRAERPAQPALKTLAAQALVRLKARNDARNARRNGSVPGRSAEKTERNALADASGWRGYFEERAAIRERDGGLSRADAEAGALADCVARWRALNPIPASANDACVQCGKARPDTPVLARGGHAWLHRECWAQMNAARNEMALAAVRALLADA